MNNLHVILIHGWGGSKKSLEKLASLFIADKVKTHVLEMSGHGETPSMKEPWSMYNYSTWLQNYVEENNIKDYVLVGHSFGGKIILDSLVNKKVEPKKVFLINISGIKPKNSLKKIFFKTMARIFAPIKDAKILRPVRKIFYKYIIREQDYLKTNNTLKETFKNINEEHYDSKLDNIKTDSIIIWGKDDRITPLWMGKKLNNLLKNSKLYILEGTHGLPLFEPEKVYKIISKHL